MEPFSAVVTTGIYCRPGCGGRPHPDHVQPFALAAAAEAAGFRACLRCRPYRAPQTVSWSGPELVCRGVQLVLGGILDGGDEQRLGARLGVSPRHLRRLFQTHLGVTPDGLARSRRSHFARRLLDDTDLTVTDVAFASGFGSVRQLNRACQEVFRASPSELRSRRRRADRLVADGGLALRLPIAGSLDWDALARYLAARATPGVEQVADGTYRRTVLVEGDPGVLEIERGGSEHLVLRAHLPHWEGLIHVVDRVRRLTCLDVDMEPPLALLGGDPVIGSRVRARSGLRVPGTWDPFETGVRAILGQQVSVAGATTMAGRVVERWGTPVPGLVPFGLSHLFPTAERLADADLGAVGVTPARAEAIRAFARAIGEGVVRLDGSTGLEELVGSLSSLPGVGPWTAHYVALRLGEPDAFPAGDLGLRRALGVSSSAAVAEAGERWRPWRALAAVHLWSA